MCATSVLSLRVNSNCDVKNKTTENTQNSTHVYIGNIHKTTSTRKGKGKNFISYLLVV